MSRIDIPNCVSTVGDMCVCVQNEGTVYSDPRHPGVRGSAPHPRANLLETLDDIE